MIYLELIMRARIRELIKNQQETYQDVFQESSSTCHQPTFHYDWWMFPQKVSPKVKVSTTSRKFSISDEDTSVLLRHKKFISTYLNSIDKYLANLERYGWNHYDIRYAKMLHSLDQFIKISAKSDDLVKHHLQLKKLAQRAINFAAQNITKRSSLLEAGLLKLNAALGNKALPNTSSWPNNTSLMLSLGTMVTMVAGFNLLGLSYYFLPLAFCGVLAAKMAWDRIQNHQTEIALKDTTKKLPPKRLKDLKQDKHTLNQRTRKNTIKGGADSHIKRRLRHA